MFMDTPLRDFEVAGAHILIASVLSPDIQMAHMNFGLVMAERRRYSLAYLSIKEALRMDPQDTGAEIALDRLSTLIGQDARNSAPSGFAIEEYDSGYPNKVVQVRQDSSGREVPDGIWTEWHENGMLKRFIDYEEGVKHGFEINWDPDGKTVSRVHYNRGVRIGPSRQDAELQDYSVTRTHYERGVELAAEGKLDKALENLKTAVSLHPYSAAFHNMLGVVYARKGVLDNAIEEFRIANGLDPSEPAYQRNLDRASRLNNEGSR
jgi:tetratricopeptide (TPR) repeat protein